VEFKWGDQLKHGGPSATTLHGPAGPLAAGDHLKHDNTQDSPTYHYKIPMLGFL